MNTTGILRIQTYGARQSSPIEGVIVTVTGNGFTIQRITDAEGNAADLSIEAPSCALSLQEDNTVRPYAVVDLTAVKAGYRTGTFGISRPSSVSGIISGWARVTCPAKICTP